MIRRILPVVAGSLLASCGAPPSGRNVLLVTFDTTRADRIAGYGCPDARTPVLDRLARQGAVLELAIVDVPVTLPSHVSLMTGVPALRHGVRYNGDFMLGPAAETLAERFVELGYETGAVVSALVLDAKFGLAQGFRHYEDDLTPGYVRYDESLYPRPTHWLPKADRRAAETVDVAIEWLEETARSPFFLWVHFYDPHFPYDPPPPWAAASPEPYLGEIQFTDHELGRLIAWLAREGKLHDTVVLVTSDHGEGLDQHREDGHGIFLYDDTVRVPAIARSPGTIRPGTVVPDQVRSIDAAPTLLELAGHAPELGTGGSLLPLLTGTGPAPDTVAYCESIKTKLFYSGSGLKAIRTRGAKFVWAPRPEVYDLREDPGEAHDLARNRPRRTGELRRLLEEKVRSVLGAGPPWVEDPQIDEETAEGLRSLGYLTGGRGSRRPGSFSQEMELTGNDPKDLVDVSMGAREIQNGFYENGEKKLLRFFRTARTPEQDPRMARLWAAAHQNYAKIWMIRGDYLAAAREYKRASEVDPGYDTARWSRIYALNLGGEAAVAEREAARILDGNPTAWRVRLHRALSLALLGRRDEAIVELRAVVAGAPASATARSNAKYYLGKLGGPDERSALTAYLDSERR